MKSNRGFTLIELLAVIVVLAIVMVLAATTVLPYMSTARESAFELEATNVVKAAANAKDLYTLGQIKTNADTTKSCVSGTTMCFTIDELIDLGIYDSEKDTFKGYIKISNYTSTPTYSLYLNKDDEFKIIGGSNTDYTDYAGSLTGEWKTDYESCSCS